MSKIGIIFLAVMFFSPHARGEKISASYEVPVPVEWKDYAVFSMEDFEITETESGKFIFSYTLPLEITGIVNKFQFVEKYRAPGMLYLRGKNNSRMVCKLMRETNKCSVSYRGIRQNLSEVKALLEERGTSADEVALRLKVAEFVVKDASNFKKIVPIARGGGDLEGFITYFRK